MEAVKDTVKTVDRKVSDKLVDGIEIGRKCSLLYFLPPQRCLPLLGPGRSVVTDVRQFSIYWPYWQPPSFQAEASISVDIR